MLFIYYLILQDLEERYNQLCALNDSNNNAAMSEARDGYISYIESVYGDYDCMSNQHFEREHENAYERASEIFQSKRLRHFNNCEDFYKSLLGKVSYIGDSNFCDCRCTIILKII